MGLFRQEYWRELPCPPPGDLPDPGIKPESLMSPAQAGGFFTTKATWEAPEFSCGFGTSCVLTPGQAGSAGSSLGAPSSFQLQLDKTQDEPSREGFGPIRMHNGPKLISFIKRKME